MKNQLRASDSNWPVLPSPVEWKDTFSTVHMWTQVVGKIRLELSPWVNHSWGSVLYVSPRGLTTSPIYYDGYSFEIEFNFIEHKLVVSTSQGDKISFGLKTMPVSEFYRKTMDSLKELDIDVKIFTRPVEVEAAIPFEEDTVHKSYDEDAVNLFWQALVQVNRVFAEFRAGFIGKSSPSHFFWGAFDLAVTRFSGRTAPKHPGGAPNCADWVMEEAYSHELSSAGFWPGAGLNEAAFYAYAYPAPEEYETCKVDPEAAYYHDDLQEYVLPYSAVQNADDPDFVLHTFLQSTYEAAANSGHWHRQALERKDFKNS